MAAPSCCLWPILRLHCNVPVTRSQRSCNGSLVLREVAEYPNSFGPLAPGDERIDTGRYTLCMGPGSTWNTVQRQRFALEELDDVLAEIRAALRERGRPQTQWEVGSSAPPASSMRCSSAGSCPTRTRTPWPWC